MRVCCFVISFRLCFKHPLCLSIDRRSIQHSSWFRPLAKWPHDVSSVLSLGYFHKNYLAYDKIFVKIRRFERGHSYQFQLVFIWVFFELELGWVKVAWSLAENPRLVGHQTLHRTLLVHLMYCFCCRACIELTHSVLSASGVTLLRCPQHQTLGERLVVCVWWSHEFWELSAYGSGDHRARPVLT